ncbi:MAG: preprotein translocase subunit SecE [Bacilli bacterium]|nr:preprotein translocase subunit SecE [Bacilli bacterium]
MNNNINFDPMTGQPINQNLNNNVVPEQNQAVNVQPVPTVEPVQPVPVEPIDNLQPAATVNNGAYIQQQMQNIPTVEQSKQEFINNTQANSTMKKEEKKEGPNLTFIVILFVIIFAAIFFLFPYLLKVL